MLPAFRAVVAPFAGLVNLSPARALLPIAAACAVWYGGLVFLGHAVGENWQSIEQVVGKLDRGLWIAAAVVLLALTLWILRRRRLEKSRVAELRPFDPSAPDRPAELEEGIPRVTAEALEAARRAGRQPPDNE